MYEKRDWEWKAADLYYPCSSWEKLSLTMRISLAWDSYATHHIYLQKSFKEIFNFEHETKNLATMIIYNEIRTLIQQISLTVSTMARTIYGNVLCLTFYFCYALLKTTFQFQLRLQLWEMDDLPVRVVRSEIKMFLDDGKLARKL